MGTQDNGGSSSERGLGYIYKSRVRQRALGTVHATGERPMGELYQGQGGKLVDLLLAVLGPCAVCGAKPGEPCTVNTRSGKVLVHQDGKRTEHLTSAVGKG